MSRQNAPSTAIEVDPKMQMVIMDRLPLELKRIIWGAPVPLDLREVMTMQTHVRHRGPDKLSAAILYRYPDWRPG